MPAFTFTEATGTNGNAELPAGVVDGVNTTFSTMRPFGYGILLVVVDRQVYIPGVDYTTDAQSTIFFTSAPVPTAQIRVYY